MTFGISFLLLVVGIVALLAVHAGTMMKDNEYVPSFMYMGHDVAMVLTIGALGMVFVAWFLEAV